MEMPANGVSAKPQECDSIDLSTSIVNEYGIRQGPELKIPGVNIPESAQSIISVEVLAEESVRSDSNQGVCREQQQQ